MDSLFFFGIPAIALTSYLYVQKHNITKVDCIQFGLTQLNNVYNGYNYVKYNVGECINTYTKKDYKEFEIIYKKNLSDTIIEIEYNYNNTKYIIYDDNDSISTNLKKGDCLNYKDILIEPLGNQQNDIVLIEYINITDNSTHIVDNNVKDNIIKMSGPNKDFYKRKTIYIPYDLIKKSVIDNINEYNIKITFMNLSEIQKNIILYKEKAH